MTANRQRGVVLIVALVILLVVTLLGVAVMKGATLDLKMAKNSQERQQAFNAAEAALSQAEARLMTVGFLTNAGFIPGCAGANCFNATCTNGFCFFGAYNGISQASCSVVPASGVIPADPWSSATLSVWNTASKHAAPALTATAMGTATAKYIAEFRCFIDGDSGTVAAGYGDALFRITARGKSAAGNSEVMLQSTFRLKAPH